MLLRREYLKALWELSEHPLQPPLLTRLLVVARGDIIGATMERVAIISIVLGAMFFDRGLLPGLLGALMETLWNFGDQPSPSRRPMHHIRTDMRRYGDIRLVLGGGVMMIFGLLALP